MKILTKAYERNQSSEERLFGILHRRQTGRPNIIEDKILKELQIAQFAKYPTLFKNLGYNNQQANEMLSSFSWEQISHEEDTDEPLEDLVGEGESPISEIIAQILFEREFDDDLNDENDENIEEDSGARYFIGRSF